MSEVKDGGPGNIGLMADLRKLVADGEEIQATDQVVEHLDLLFSVGTTEQMGACGVILRLLSVLEPKHLPPKVVSGAMMIVASAIQRKQRELDAFRAAQSALLNKIQGVYPDEMVESMRKRFL